MGSLCQWTGTGSRVLSTAPQRSKHECQGWQRHLCCTLAMLCCPYRTVLDRSCTGKTQENAGICRTPLAGLEPSKFCCFPEDFYVFRCPFCLPDKDEVTSSNLVGPT